MGNSGNFIGLIADVGWMVLPILIFSIIALAIVVEHIWINFLSSRRFKNLIKQSQHFRVSQTAVNYLQNNGINEDIIKGLHNFENKDHTKEEFIKGLEAIDLSKEQKILILKASQKAFHDIVQMEYKNSDPVSTFFNWYRKNLAASKDDYKKLIEQLFQIYEHRINWLNTIAAIAPLLGLIGTVFGMMRIFTIVSVQKPSNPISALSGGISEALIATSGGLVVAVIAALGHHYLMNWLESTANKLEAWVIENNF